MTIKQARKILGKMAEGLSDKEILRDIRSAELLKNLFFENYLNQSKKTYNKQNGKA